MKYRKLLLIRIDGAAGMGEFEAPGATAHDAIALANTYAAQNGPGAMGYGDALVSVGIDGGCWHRIGHIHLPDSEEE